MLSGRVSDSRLKPNGNSQPEEDYLIKHSLGGMMKVLHVSMLIIMGLEIKISGLVRLHVWAVFCPMDMVCTICRAMFGNGVRIGMTRVKNIVFAGVALGLTLCSASVWVIALMTFQRLSTTMLVFVVFQV